MEFSSAFRDEHGPATHRYSAWAFPGQADIADRVAGVAIYSAGFIHRNTGQGAPVFASRGGMAVPYGLVGAGAACRVPTW